MRNICSPLSLTSNRFQDKLPSFAPPQAQGFATLITSFTNAHRGPHTLLASNDYSIAACRDVRLSFNVPALRTFNLNTSSHCIHPSNQVVRANYGCFHLIGTGSLFASLGQASSTGQASIYMFDSQQRQRFQEATITCLPTEAAIVMQNNSMYLLEVDRKELVVRLSIMSLALPLTTLMIKTCALDEFAVPVQSVSLAAIQSTLYYTWHRAKDIYSYDVVSKQPGVLKDVALCGCIWNSAFSSLVAHQAQLYVPVDSELLRTLVQVRTRSVACVLISLGLTHIRWTQRPINRSVLNHFSILKALLRLGLHPTACCGGYKRATRTFSLVLSTSAMPTVDVCLGQFLCSWKTGAVEGGQLSLKIQSFWYATALKATRHSCGSSTLRPTRRGRPSRHVLSPIKQLPAAMSARAHVQGVRHLQNRGQHLQHPAPVPTNPS